MDQAVNELDCHVDCNINWDQTVIKPILVVFFAVKRGRIIQWNPSIMDIPVTPQTKIRPG